MNRKGSAPALTPEQSRIVEAVIERAEQACRYALKHQTFEQESPGKTSEFESGWTVGAETCEAAIRSQVLFHIAQDLAAAEQAPIEELP